MTEADYNEKLVNEHDSTTILRERIALLNKQHAALEKQVVTLKQEVALLKREKALIRKPGKAQDQVQADLIYATYLCLANSGATTPFQQIFDAVGNTADRRRIIKWVETFAPVRMVQDKILLNKTAWGLLDRVFILSNFDAYIKETGMDNVKWYSIVAKTTKSLLVSIVSGGGVNGTGKRR